MPTSKPLTNFVINKLESQEIYDYLSENSLINEDEIYLIEGDSGGETVSATHTMLASGTVDAGITSATIGDGIIDTGLTLADLQAYKYFYYKIRLDDNKPYLGLRIGSTVVSRANSNGVSAEYTWVDSDQTMIMPISFNVGNSGISGSPATLANNYYYTHNTLDGQQFLGAISGLSSTDKIYLGCLHMNGLAETTKTMSWAIAGFGGLS